MSEMTPGVRVAVTGAPGCGKTTLIRRVVERLRDGLSIGGIYTEEIREGGVRKGFAIIDIASGRRGTLAHVDLGAGPAVGKYRVNLEDIEEIAVPAIEDARRHKDLVVIDEIAPMELTSPGFVEVVRRALKSGKHLFFAIQARSSHPLARQIRAEFTLFEVTRSNRAELPQRIIALFC